MQIDELAATFYETNTAKPAVLLIHGWQSNQKNAETVCAEVLQKAGYTCLAFDQRGHGQTPGDLASLSCKDFVADCVKAYDWLLEKTGKKINVVGTSFGGYLACMLLGKREVERVCLRAPANYPNHFYSLPVSQTILQIDPIWREKTVHYSITYALNYLHEFCAAKKRALVIECEDDSVISKSVIQSFVDAGAEHTLMRNTPHSLSQFPKKQKEFAALVRDFFES